jgi:hypothetical protein
VPSPRRRMRRRGPDSTSVPPAGPCRSAGRRPGGRDAGLPRGHRPSQSARAHNATGLTPHVDQLGGLRRIGIDEISYKRHHRYLTVVVDHDSRRLVWAAPGRDTHTLGRFFDQLGPARSAQITHVSADAADWIAEVVAARCPHAVRCADAFHIVAWATEALDQVRIQAWNDARALARTEPKRSVGRPRAGAPPRPGHERARRLRHARYALWKNPENLSERESDKLAWIAKADPRLHRAYLLKEGLRHVFAVKGEAGIEALGRWQVVGGALPHSRLRRPGPAHPQAPRGDRGRAHPRPVQRADRVYQHQDQAPAADRVRVPLRRRAQAAVAAERILRLPRVDQRGDHDRKPWRNAHGLRPPSVYGVIPGRRGSSRSSSGC